MSAPEQNGKPSAPQSRTTRADGKASSAAECPESARHIPKSKAFATRGVVDREARDAAGDLDPQFSVGELIWSMGDQ